MALLVKVGLIMLLFTVLQCYTPPAWLLDVSWPDCDCDGNTIFV